jgi:DNA-binding transcriptional MocR family regulator
LTVPPGVRDLTSGEPDPALLPALPEFKASRHRYTDPSVSPRLRRAAGESFTADGIAAGHLAVVAGALDGVERVLGAWLRAGDSVAVEDPGYGAVLDLVAAMGLDAMPVAVDENGAMPSELVSALRQGASAVVLTPRAQNPTGAAWDAGRGAALHALLASFPDVLVVEDDHAGPVAGTAARTVGGATEHWATIRSVSKWLGPDFRLAVLAGDEATVARVEGRQALGAGWVSYFLQDAAAKLWSDSATAEVLARATEAYALRRRALKERLQGCGLEVTGRSGLTTWLPVDDELGVVSGLMEAGWAVSPGERFRVASPPAVRIAHSTMHPEEAGRFVSDLTRVLRRSPHRSG